MERQYVIDDFKLSESWRLFKILGEFVDGVENLHDLGPAVSIFGSARTKPDDPVYKQAVAIARAFAEAGFAVIPFEAFGLRNDDGWVRLSVGAVSVDEVRAGLTRVRTLLERIES